MKVSVIRTRICGVLLPKRAWSRESTYDGDLAIAITRDNRLNRLSKTARLLYDAERGRALELMDVSLEWVNEERLVLTGFEPHTENGQVVDYAQSWLCLVGTGRRLKTEQEQYEEEQARISRGRGITLSNKK
jgi:hypothetical protein